MYHYHDLNFYIVFTSFLILKFVFLHIESVETYTYIENRHVSHIRYFQHASRSGRLATTTTEENIQAMERIVKRDRQVSVRRAPDELGIPKTIVHEIMTMHLCMRKVCVR